MRPEHTPDALIQACKCEPIDPCWPIGSPLEAIQLLYDWEVDVCGASPIDINTLANWLTHSHHHEYADLKRLGVDRLYRESHFTKCVSIGWHLAGRYTYDIALIDELTRLGWPKWKLIDFGAAPWIQSIYYHRKGLDVTAVNQSLDSEVHRFGKWLAARSNVPDGAIREFGSEDPGWQEITYDIVYAVDVLEHIPPTADGTPGWISYAEALLKTLRQGGIWYVNAPLDVQPGVPRPVETHPVHYTSPISLSEWQAEHGLVQHGYLWIKG